MEIKSRAFKDGEMIPEKYTCLGENISPPLEFKDIPRGTKSLALIMQDPDAPIAVPWVHWVLYDIGLISRIEENSSAGTKGKNTQGRLKYSGPCPPSGTHRYFFKLYALKEELKLGSGARKDELVAAMKDKVIDEAQLVGLFQKQAYARR